MPTIRIQLHPHRVPELNLQEIRAVLEAVGATPRLVQRHGIEQGVTFTFETSDPGELWGLIEDELFREPAWGRLARKASIVTCDELVLHHFDPAVPRASIPEQNEGKRSPRCG